MRTLAEIKRRFAVGQLLLCVENTKQPRLNGTVRQIEKVKTVAIICRFVGDVIPSPGPFWTRFPPAKDIAVIDDDTFSLGLGDGHSVTLRFMPAP